MSTAITITTNIGCRVQCKFCPQDDIMTSYAEKEKGPKIEFGNPVMMTYQTFVSILEKIPKDISIIFSGFTEPYLNPECGKMIEYAFERGHGIQVFSTLVGMTLLDVDILKKVNEKLTKFVIHLPDVEKYAKIALTSELKQVLEKIISLPIKNTRLMSMGTVPEKIENIIGVKINASEMVSWAGHIDYVDQNETVDGPILCGIDDGGDNKGIPAVVVPSGDVVLCVKDWSMEYILGNLLKCTFEDLYQSKRYKEVIQRMASDNDNVLCRNCEHAISVKKIQESEQKLKDLQIDRTDKISQKLDEIWQIYLSRPIDADGLIYFYDKIKNKKMDLTEIVRHVKNSSEYLSQRFKIN